MCDDAVEAKNEEREALVSIYDGDDAFKQIDASTFQYKFGQEGDGKTFIVELKWTDKYPNEAPTINLNVFYNQQLSAPVKDKIREILSNEAEQWIGCGMTYTLFECLKDRIDEIMACQPVKEESSEESEEEEDDDDDEDGSEETTDSDDSDAGISKLSISKPKKEQLTKAQKRRQWDHIAAGGERPRGWDWIDIVKHLSQVGNKDEAGAIPQHYNG